MADSFDFRVLGAVEAFRNGERLPLGGPRQRVLLALLLLEPGRPVSVDRLAEELWQGSPPAGASTTLRSYVSKLRTTLGTEAPISSGPGGYALEVAPDRVDAHRFEQLTREGEHALVRRRVRRAAAHLREALDLWRGRPFAECGSSSGRPSVAETQESRCRPTATSSSRATIPGAEGIGIMELIVRKNTVVWLLNAKLDHRPALPKATLLAELKKYALKQKRRVGSG